MRKDLKVIRGLNNDWAGAKIKKAGGQTNRNYIVERGSKKFFVRLPWESGAIDRGIEAKNILALSHNKKLEAILPEYYLYIYKKKNILDPQSREKFQAPDGTMILEYIPGKPFAPFLFKKEEYQKKLAEMFYIFHSSSIRFANRYDVFRDEIDKYKKSARKHPLPDFIAKESIFDLERIEKEAKKEVPFSKKGVPAHNDFIFQNFIAGVDGRLYLLDFEYAGMNERGGKLYDFAFLFADNFFRKPAISPDLFEKFLKIADKIYGRPLERKKIWSLAAVVPVMQVWWGLLRYSDVETQKKKNYFKNYILERVQGISRLSQLIKQKGVKKP